MNPAAPTPPAVCWPTPPFFKLAEPPAPGSSRQCAVEFVDGRVRRAELVDFQRGMDSIGVRPSESSGIKRIDLAMIRSIKSARPSVYVADVAALAAIGATDERMAPHKPFTVLLRNGTKMAGSTLGFIKEKDGLFLFLVERNSGEVIDCFIPAGQIEDVQIGPLLGDLLVENQVVSADALAGALTKQATLRQERIGSYLTDRAIISVEELRRALSAQGKRPNVRLGDLLVETQVITAEQLKEALAIQATHRGRRIGEILIDMGAVSMRLIQFALSDKLGIPYVNVREFTIGPGTLEKVDTAFAIRYQVLPLLLIGDSLVVAVEDPLASDFMQELRVKTGLTIDPVIANPQELKVRIAKEYSNLEARAEGKPGTGTAGASDAARDPRSSGAAQAQVADLTSQLARESRQSIQPAKDTVVDARVSDNTLVKLVNKIIIEAHAQGASDIHIESNGGKSDTRIRFRKDGDLEDYLELPQAYSNALVSRIKIMAELNISEHRHPQDGKIDFGKHGPLAIELRVAIIPTANSLEDVVLRILGGAEPLPLDQVGFSDRDLQTLKAMISRSYGLILVCGPTGSGKTTTLHSVLRDINRPDIKIWTAEDPIEITQPGLRQVQVHPKINWTFAAAMRAFLRADPDVIMVGEMRDAETTKIGIEASLTGHLVFSTLHTNSAAESIVRLLDMGMDPFNFADALIGILSQRLARKLCPNCKQAHVASEIELSELVGEYCSGTKLDPATVLSRWQTDFGKEGHVIFRKAVGCDSCKDGYKGRVVVYELLPGSAEVKHLVRSHGTVPELLATAQESGMLSLRQNAIEKLLRGVLDLPSARAVSS
ncbi:MAG: Flp pilus assembly complex ATPase component TadA [Pseudomonadota bacterium]|nr:Flp pilus assembly complex ATPase component TadA [Pseudomonadota bacterium]